VKADLRTTCLLPDFQRGPALAGEPWVVGAAPASLPIGVLAWVADTRGVFRVDVHFSRQYSYVCIQPSVGAAGFARPCGFQVNTDKSFRNLRKTHTLTVVFLLTTFFPILLQQPPILYKFTTFPWKYGYYFNIHTFYGTKTESTIWTFLIKNPCDYGCLKGTQNTMGSNQVSMKCWLLRQYPVSYGCFPSFRNPHGCVR
jgi:hypothetical protein